MPRIISADDHVIDPPGLWLDRLPAKYHDRAPRVVRKRAQGIVAVDGKLTILESPEDTEALVIEAGANTPGELPRYREIIEPTITEHPHPNSYRLLAHSYERLGLLKDAGWKEEDIPKLLQSLDEDFLPDVDLAAGTLTYTVVIGEVVGNFEASQHEK